jgi:obg-like ATPase 1
VVRHSPSISPNYPRLRRHPNRLPKIKAWIDEHNPGDPLIPFSVSLEERLAPLDSEEQKEEEVKVGASSALGKITTAGYASLELIRYFTCGPDEVRAWTIRKGIKAPQAAGVIQWVPLVGIRLCVEWLLMCSGV